MRASLLFVLAAAAAVLLRAERVPRSEPNDWFASLIAADQAAEQHDHSGEAAPKAEHLCCHRLAFNIDPAGGTDLMHTVVPYNFWWRSGATLISVAPELDAPAERMLEIGDHGLLLDFRARSRIFIRIQCAYACCIEGAEFMTPRAAAPLDVLAGNAAGHEEWPFVFDRAAALPPGVIEVGVDNDVVRRSEYMWTRNTHHDRAFHEHTRRGALHMCDHTGAGLWIRVDSVTRNEATLAELDVCFVDHSLALGWDTGLCEEY
jgi:hypothetical protein